MNYRDESLRIVRLDDALKIKITKDRNWTGRMYEYDGLRGVSVSTAMDCIVPVELQDWYKRTSEEEIDSRVSASQEIGTELHKIPESESQGALFEPRKELQGWYENWKAVQKEYEIDEEYSEIPVFSKEFLYGGTIDRVGKFQGKRCVIDFKTGRYSHINLWKTEAYRQAWMEMTGERDIGAVVLHLPRPDLLARGQKPRPYTIAQHLSCFASFLAGYYNFKMLYFRELKESGYPEGRLFEPILQRLFQKIEKGEFV